MKRGLKAENTRQGQVQMFVATVAPMKRGLKDEVLTAPIEAGKVATVAPMKRGLKAQQTAPPKQADENSSNRCPDEKGTESSAHPYRAE